jgi:trimethylamine--corrinoid protein Co-methyltransferase
MTALAALLTDQQVRQVHAASLQVLEDIGLLVRLPEARVLFGKHGCRVDAESEIVKFPRAVVEEFRQMFPPTFTFRGRDPGRWSADRDGELCPGCH